MGAFGTDQEWSSYGNELLVYAREACSIRDFVQLLRVRLALSKLGRVVCPNRVTVEVGLRSLGSVEIRSHTTDIAVLGELIVSGAYAPLAEIIDHPVTTIVDLGANTGLASRWLAAQFPGAQVVCVEPEPSNVAVLRSNLTPLDGASVVAACVGGTRRKVALDTSAGHFGVTMVESPSSVDAPIDVVMMDDVLTAASLETVDLLKCDIEGAERELFDDCGAWIDRVGTLVVECHGVYGLSDLLDDLDRGRASFEVRHLEANTSYGNVVAILARKQAMHEGPCGRNAT